MWLCPKCGREFAVQEQEHACPAAPRDVDEYISLQREEVRPALQALREAVREAVPDAVERISWSMPTYWRGRNLLQFGASKKHLGFYPGREAVQAFADRLEGYEANKGTIRLPYDRPLPLELVKDVAKWCRERYGK